MRAILLLLLLYPLLEIATLVTLAHHLGGGVVFLLVVASSLLGIWMLRNQKLGALITLTSVVRQGQQVSLYSLLWPLRYALSGLLFAIPGILSDVLAILLLLPFKGPKLNTMANPGAMADDVIEGEFSRVDPKRSDTQRHLP
ncbi:exlusion protein FxsA [Aquitalea magnusonii]|uniref:FxsA family protein n=1 Tax=Aquitalea TaxID=407217 RepID=UPI0005F7D4A8|nr:MULTISPECIES: FxsA family protein [Aquitalea]KJV29840.1 exlusion protein FxsA [Aquitalea magnusonii]QBJ77669.1 FxsA family protein [Aquitalea sp. USM4]